MEKLTEQVGDKIRLARIEKGLSQKELAELIGVDHTTFSRFENGKQNLTLQTLHRISVALGKNLLVDFT